MTCIIALGLALVQMSIFSRLSGSVLVVAALCLAAPAAHAQVAAVPYSQTNWPLGFGGNLAMGANAYGNFAGLDEASRPKGWFINGQSSEVRLGLSGINQMSAFGSFGSLQSDGMWFGYNFQNSPVTIYGGFDTVKFNPGIASAFTPSALSGTASGYSMQAGVEFRPASNLSLSLGASFIQMQPGRTDSDKTSNALTGESSGCDRVRAR
jgi:opacity protein-like surface antigen